MHSVTATAKGMDPYVEQFIAKVNARIADIDIQGITSINMPTSFSEYLAANSDMPYVVPDGALARMAEERVAERATEEFNAAILKEDKLLEKFEWEFERGLDAAILQDCKLFARAAEETEKARKKEEKELAAAAAKAEKKELAAAKRAAVIEQNQQRMKEREQILEQRRKYLEQNQQRMKEREQILEQRRKYLSEQAIPLVNNYLSEQAIPLMKIGLELSPV